MENYRLTQTGEEVQDILNGAAMQTDLTAEVERAEGAEQTLQGNIDEEERRAKAAEETLSGAIGDEELRAKAAEEALGGAIDGINAKIPAAASSENKLADQDFVNSSIETATATFRGTYNLVSDLHLAVDATHEQIATLLSTVIAEADNNDYSYVLVPTSAQTPTEIASIEKYTFGANGWAFAYALNNSGFTSAQWAAINSGITSGLVAKLNALPTNTDLLALLAGKQDVLTFDDVPVEGSNNPVKSGGVHSAIDDEKTARVNAVNGVAGRVDTIEGEIPAQASSENQLADKAYVNSSISTNTATYRGSFNLVADLGLSVSATHEQIGTALAGEISTADNNDYAYVQVPTSDETPSQILKVERYKFNGTAWAFEYELNNSGFTSAQWAALNSGITSGLVGKLNALPTNDELTLALAGKQDVLTFDNTPTENSNNPVKSGGVYAADKALSDAIEAILLLIPSAATSLNKLVDTDLMNSSISTATATFRGTFNLVSDLSLDLTATHAQIATALAGAIATADNNDYAFVQVPTSASTPTEIAQTDRYKFNGTAWAYEYTLNTSGFTSAQWAAINSGITAALVASLADIPDLIPSEATSTNQLADKAYVLAQILAATPAFKGQFTTLAELQAVASPKAGDLGIVRTKDSDGMDVFTVYQYLSNAWNVFYSLSYHPQTKPATTGTTGDYPYNGMGRVELAKNMVNTGTELAPVMVNQLTQDMFYKGAVGSRVPNTNTIFVIRYDYVLAENITIPDGCVLEFDGGSISNGTINFNGCLFNGDYKLTDVVFSGNVLNDKLLIGDEYIGVSSSDISDIVNSIISNTTVEIIEFTQSYTNLTKAIRVDRKFITIQGSNHNITLKNPTLDVSKAETFNFENNSSLTAIATIVIGKANTRLSHWNIRNITIQTMDSWEEIAANQFGVIVTGTHWTIEDCTIQGNTAGIKGYGVFNGIIRNAIAQSINGAAYDFSEFAEGVNGTTMIIEESYAINSKIGYYLSTWVYSSLISTACDNSTECAYKFDHCAVECVSIGAESFKGSFIESIKSKVLVDGAYIVDYHGANGTLKTSETVDSNPRALIEMSNTGGLSNSWSYMKIVGLTLNNFGPYIGAVNAIENNYKLKNLNIGANCLLEFENSEKFYTGTYPSSVLGAFGNDKCMVGQVAELYGVDSYTFSKKNVSLHLIGSPASGGKDLKNVYIDNTNNGSIAVSLTDGSPLLNNCENVTIRNCYIVLNNTKMFADNTIQKNVVFDNCIILLNSVAFNTIADSSILFKDCLIRFDQDYGTTYITATNTDIKFINTHIQRTGGFSYGGVFADGTDSHAGSTRPKSPMTGDVFFDTSLSPKRPIWYNGSSWVDATGATV